MNAKCKFACVKAITCNTPFARGFAGACSSEFFCKNLVIWRVLVYI